MTFAKSFTCGKVAAEWEAEIEDPASF